MAEKYTDRIRMRIGKVQASAKADNYFPIVGQTVHIDAAMKWAQSTEWQTQDGGGNTVTAAGTVSGQKDSKDVVITNPGELRQKLIARNYLTEMAVTKVLYAMQPQVLPYFDVTATEIVRVGDTGYINIMAENGYPTSRDTTIIARIYKENESIPVKTTGFDTSRPGPATWASSVFSFDNASDRGIYDVEVDVTDTLTGITLTKRINKLITVTPKLCPKPADTTQGYEVAGTYSSIVTYQTLQKKFELRLWRDVNGSGLNYAEAVLPRGADDLGGYQHIPVAGLPGGTTLVLKADPAEPDQDYVRRLMIKGGSDTDANSDNGTTNFTYEKPLVITHDHEQEWEWNWIGYGAIMPWWNIRNVVFDGRGYHDTGIKLTPDRTRTCDSAIFVVNGSSDWEIFGFRFNGAGFAGISAKTDPKATMPWYWRGNFELKNLKIHHCDFDHTDGEGVYIGYFSSQPYNTGDGQEYFAHLVKDLRLYRCTFKSPGYDAIQINGAYGAEVCYCDIRESGRERVGDQGAAFSCSFLGRIYNCTAVDCYGAVCAVRPGAYKEHEDRSLEIYNNIFVAAAGNIVMYGAFWTSTDVYYDEGGFTNNNLKFSIHNNVLKGTGINYSSDIQFSGFTLEDNVIITERPQTGEFGMFNAPGRNVLLVGTDNYDELDAALKVADTANYNYQPSFDSMLVSAGVNSLTDYDMRGYRRWYNNVRHCGPLMGIYKSPDISDAGVLLEGISLSNIGDKTVSVSFSCSDTFVPAWYRLAETSGLSVLEWLEYSGNVAYTFDTAGDKTLYAQLKDADGQMTEIRSATVTVMAESEFLTFGDPVLGAQITDLWDTDGDGKVSLEEAAVNHKFADNYFRGNAEISNLDDLARINYGYNGDFSGMSNLVSAHTGRNTVNGTVKTSLTWNTFKDCVRLRQVVIGEDISVEIGRMSFRGCTALKDIVFSGKETIIGWQAFWGCTALETIEFPDSVTTIGESAGGNCFEGCTSLRTVILGSKIVLMKGWTFAKCSALETVVIKTVVPPNVQDEFPNTPSTCKIYVPDESVEAYKTATNWSKYADRIKPLSEYTKEV